MPRYLTAMNSSRANSFRSMKRCTSIRNPWAIQRGLGRAGLYPPGDHPGALATAPDRLEDGPADRLGHAIQGEMLAAALLADQLQRGRFETVSQVRGVHFVDNSIISCTIAGQAALQRAKPPIVWLVGERDKGTDLPPLREAARGRVRMVIAPSKDGGKLARHLGLAFVAVPGADGDGSMWAALAGPEALNGNGTVLLAPVGTSFDQCRDYAVCGDGFRLAARALTGAAEVEA